MIVVSSRLPVVLGLIVAFAAVLAPARARAEGTPLQQVNWESALRTDPRLTVRSDCAPIFDPGGLCIEATVDDPGMESFVGTAAVDPASAPIPTLTGFPVTRPGDVLYGDLDGDGQDEAVIRVESGGTAGTIGILIYRAADPRPALVTVRAGYKLYPFIQSGQLFLIEPYYFGFEGNCCPTAAVQAAYRLTGDRLELLALPDESPQWLLSGPIERRVTFAEATVVAFYRALDAGRFEDAYSFLSPAYQAEHPIAACQAGYSRTRSIEVVTSPGGSFVDGAGRRVYEVLVSLVALDEVATGGLVRRNFTGVWRLVEGEAPGLPLRLDTAQIEILP